MKLSRWLAESHLSTAEFAVRISRSRQAVHDLCRGAAQPSLSTLSAIRIATGGAVDIDDFAKQATTPRGADSSRKKRAANQ